MTSPLLHGGGFGLLQSGVTQKVGGTSRMVLFRFPAESDDRFGQRLYTACLKLLKLQE